MGCCCSTPLKINKPIIKIEDFIIDDISQNFHELGSCFVCEKNGIDVKLPWPPLHIQPANPELNNNVHEHTKLISDSALMLPIFNKMTDDEVDYVIDCCNSVN